MKTKRLTYSNFYFYLFASCSDSGGLYSVFVIPVVSSMFFSLTNFNGISLNFKWVGFNNYDVAFHDKVFKKAMVNTFLFALGATVFQNLFAIVFAMALNTKIKSKNFLGCFSLPPVCCLQWWWHLSGSLSICRMAC